MPQSPIVVTAAVRTPIGGFLGHLKEVKAPQLGAAAIGAAMERSRLPGDRVTEVLMGCVLPAGVGQAPARQAALGAGLPQSIPCATISKVCGSGMKAVMLGVDAIAAGSADVIVAGGMESMSNAPYLLVRARAGYRMGHGRVVDHMVLDGLEDAYALGTAMGSFAEEAARQFGLGRAEQDDYALRSLDRARAAIKRGWFGAETVAVTTETTGVIHHDEQPLKARPDKIPTLKPAFQAGGTITAANASSISDGAAALVLMRASEAERTGARPLAVVRGHASHAQAPAQFVTAPVGAITKLCEKLGWRVADVDLFEINEAFAVVAMIAARECGLSVDRLNVHGGACALGHPIGASGARILVTLIHALERLDLRRGIAAICIGGGEATAIAVERQR